MRVLWQTFQRKALQRWLCERGTRDSVAVACVVAFALLCSAALALRSMSSGADTLARGRRPVVVFHGKRSCDTLLQVYVCIFRVAFLVRGADLLRKNIQTLVADVGLTRFAAARVISVRDAFT